MIWYYMYLEHDSNHQLKVTLKILLIEIYPHLLLYFLLNCEIFYLTFVMY